MNGLTNWFTRKLEPFLVYSEYGTEALFYGVNMALYTISSTLLLVIIGFVSGYPLYTIVLISTFYLNQTVGGGFHATSHLKCLLSMCIFLVLGLCLIHISFPSPLLLILSLVAIVIMLQLPVVLHPNKHYLNALISLHKVRSRLIILIELILLSILAISRSPYFAAFSIALSYSALSRIIGKMVYK